MIQKPKGTQDIYGSYGNTIKYINNFIDDFMLLYNYEFIKTPTFEYSELYKRGVGESTDIVNKETYDFKDKSDRELTLRPEETAGVVRMLLENKLYSDGVINKFYYNNSCYRYERPQSGRFREFTQFGVEVFGSKNSYLDAEVITLAYRFLTRIGLKNLKVVINTLGDSQSREEYKKALTNYLSKEIDNLCDDCKKRYKTNPLRILDCKIDNNNEIIKNAPKSFDYLNEESKTFYEKLKEILGNMGIPYEENNTLVRGLDYYTDTVFEIISTNSNLGLASTVCGGGRYDGLTKILGGPQIPAVGFAIGVDRLSTLLQEENADIRKENVDIFIMNLYNGDEAYILCDELRSNGFITEIDYLNRNMKNQFKLVDKLNPTYVLILGEDEIKGNYITLKDNATKENIKIKREELIDYLNVNL